MIDKFWLEATQHGRKKQKKLPNALGAIDELKNKELRSPFKSGVQTITSEKRMIHDLVVGGTLERTDTGRNCKLHIEMPQARNRTHDFLAVRQSRKSQCHYISLQNVFSIMVAATFN